MPDERQLPDRPENDHRVLGREMGIFTSSELLGSGLPIWLPKGAVIRRELENFVRSLEEEAGYLHVYTPPLAKRELYEVSGHWAHYQDSMFPPMRLGEEEVVLRPMNCPHHILVYKNEGRSYRDLPLRIAELGQMFRNELSGAVGGLSRVRCMTLNDGHVFAPLEQVEEEITSILDLISRAYLALGLPAPHLRLSKRGPGEKYVQNDALWDSAEDILRSVLSSSGLSFSEAEGEAAFYGPKIDIQVQGHAGKEETLSTVQLDFHLPERFALEYTGSDGARHRPVMIHRSIVSTFERMVAFLLEVHGKNLPLWLSPVQAAVLPVSEASLPYAEEVRRALAPLRVVLDAEGPLGSRIAARRAEVPYLLVVGEKEEAARSVALRRRGERKAEDISLSEAHAHLNLSALSRSIEL